MKTSFFMIAVLGCSLALAQQSRQYSFKKFSVNNGLASNSVLRVAQDRDGFIWLATSNGLQRYDGSSFITFKPEPGNSSSVPDVKITQLYIDRHQHLWLFGDNKKAGIFDTRKFSFTETAIPGNKPDLFIQQGFFELPTGEIVMLKTDGNFLVHQPASNSFVASENIIPKPKGWLLKWLHWDQRNKVYWLACDSGLAQYNPGSKLLNYRGHNPGRDPVIQAFAAQTSPARCFTDAAGNLIFIQWPPHSAAPDIHRYHRRTGKKEKFSSGHDGYHEVDYFIQQAGGRLWAYGKPFMAEWKEKQGQVFFEHLPNAYRNEQSLRFDHMHQVYEDKQRNLWLATDDGLYLFNPDKQVFNTYYLTDARGKTLTGGVQSMAQLKDGRVFIGSWGSAGVSCYDKDFNPLPMPAFPKGEISTWDMTVHPKTGDLWIAMQGGSVVVYNTKTNSFKRISDPAFGGSTVRQVEDDTLGNMWFGTQNGRVIRWDYRKSNGDPSKGYELVLQTGLVHKLHYEYTGYLWIGTLERGLVKMDTRTLQVVKTITSGGAKGDALFNNSPTDMAYLDDSTLLVAAGCLNIVNTRTHRVHFIKDTDGLPSNTAVSVEKDKNGTVWLGMANGLCRINVEKKLVTYYDRRDGIADDKFNIAGVTELSDGRLCFFTDHNFMAFQPDGFSQAIMPPKPLLTQFKLAGKRLNLDSLATTPAVSLHHNNTSVSISFSALSYLQQNKLMFYYMLEGLEEDWQKSDKPIEVVYNYLAPGDYTFKVKTENADGLMNPQIASIRIHVDPPFWKSWWFISTSLLLLIGFLYLIDKERMRKRKALHLLRNQIRQNLKEEVSTALGNIHVLSKMAGIKAERDPQLSKNYIYQISEKSKEITEVMNDTLWSIDPVNDGMEHTLGRMREWSVETALRSGIRIDFTTDDKIARLRLDMQQRRELYLLYKDTVQYLLNESEPSQLFATARSWKGKIRIELIAETNNPVAADIETELQQILKKRIAALNASADVLVERNGVSVLFQVYPQR